MKRITKSFKENFSLYLLGSVFVFSLFNPFFKKFDYGAGWPVVILLAVAFMFIAFCELRKERKPEMSETMFLFLFLFFVGLSFVFSSTQNVGLSEVVALFTVGGLYHLFAYRKVEWMEKFLKLVVVCAVLSVVVGYFAYFFEADTRVYGPFFNVLYHSNEWPNAFALFLLMSWPLLLLFFDKKKSIQSSLLMGVLISGLLLTFSRGALVAFVGQIVLLLIFFVKKIKFKQFLLGVVSILFAFILFSGANYIRSFGNEVLDVSDRVNFVGTEVTSKTERVDFWVGAAKLASERPAFGWGPFSFRQAYSPIQKRLLGASDHPHNFFLKIAAENGMIALIAFLGFLGVFLMDLEKRLPEVSAPKKKTIAILSVALLGGLAHSMIDYNFNFVANLLLWFMLLAFIRSLSMPRIYKKKAALLPLFLALLVGLLSIYEGGILVMDKITDNDVYMEKSLYPRDHYLEADLERHLELNKLDAKAHHRAGNFEKALELDPMNDFVYYRDYLWKLKNAKLNEDNWMVINRANDLLLQYYVMVENNVHFTAYTKNVEAASDVADALVEYLPEEKVYDLIEGKKRMLEKAKSLREQRK